MASEDPLEPLRRRRDQIDQLKTELKETQQRRLALGKSIENHQSYDPGQERRAIGTLQRQHRTLTQAISAGESNSTEFTIKFEAAKKERANIWQLQTYFSNEQKLIRADARRLKKQISTNKRDLESQRAALAGNIATTVEARDRLASHQAFDLASAQASLAKAEDEERAIKSFLEPRERELADLQAHLAPHLTEHRRLQSALAAAKDVIRAAEHYDRRLEDAGSGAERARIHEECEAKLGSGSPKKIIGARSKEKRQLERDIAKIERRIGEEIMKFEIRVEHLIVDGNNICYEREEFIGLRAIEALIDNSRDRFKTTIIFDASIRRLLKSRDNDIEILLESGCKVYVSPTRTSADEYLIRLADKDTNAYILSNDRFSEYRDHDAIQNGRVIRFMIADDRLIINALDIVADIPPAP